MNFYDILGWIAASFGMASALPQLYHLWRVRTSAGLSARLWQFNAAGTMAWAMHGFYVGAVQLGVPNIVCTALFLGVLWFIVRDRGQNFLPMLVLPVALSLVLFGIDLWLGPVVFGVVVALPMVVGQVTQLQYMRSSAHLAGVSVPTLLVTVLVQVLWFTWGIGVGERAITVASTLLGTLCIANLAYYAWRSARGTAKAVVGDEMPTESAENLA